MVVDSSAVMAVLLGEPERLTFLRLLHTTGRNRMSAATRVELGIAVVRRVGIEGEPALIGLLERSRTIIEPVTEAQVSIALEAFRSYGKGRHKARLNFGDTFSYALAKATGEPLLFKGNDFAQTDVTPAV